MRAPLASLPLPTSPLAKPLEGPRLLDAFLRSASKPTSAVGSRESSPTPVKRPDAEPPAFEIYQDEPADSSVVIETASDLQEDDDGPKENSRPTPLPPLAIAIPARRPVTPPPFRLAGDGEGVATALVLATTPPSSASASTSTPSFRFAESLSTFAGLSGLLPGFSIVASPPKSAPKRPSLGNDEGEERDEKRRRVRDD